MYSGTSTEVVHSRAHGDPHLLIISWGHRVRSGIGGGHYRTVIPARQDTTGLLPVSPV